MVFVLKIIRNWLVLVKCYSAVTRMAESRKQVVNTENTKFTEVVVNVHS